MDNAGNRTSKLNQQNGVTENYTYDPLYQLTQVQQIVNGNQNTTESYSYDAVGNRRRQHPAHRDREMRRRPARS